MYNKGFLISFALFVCCTPAFAKHKIHAHKYVREGTLTASGDTDHNVPQLYYYSYPQSGTTTQYSHDADVELGITYNPGDHDAGWYRIDKRQFVYHIQYEIGTYASRAFADGGECKAYVALAIASGQGVMWSKGLGCSAEKEDIDVEVEIEGLPAIGVPIALPATTQNCDPTNASTWGWSGSPTTTLAKSCSDPSQHVQKWTESSTYSFDAGMGGDAEVAGGNSEFSQARASASMTVWTAYDESDGQYAVEEAFTFLPGVPQ